MTTIFKVAVWLNCQFKVNAKATLITCYQRKYKNICCRHKYFLTSSLSFDFCHYTPTILLCQDIFEISL